MSPTVIRVVVDGAAVAKGRPQMTKTGIAYTPTKTRKYEAHGRLAAQAVMTGREPLVGPLEVSVIVELPIPASWSKRKRDAAVGMPVTTRPDADNYLKAALDICNGIVFVDDSQVWCLHCYKTYGRDPSLRIEVLAR